MEPGPELDRLEAEKVMGWKRTTEGAPPGCAYWKDDDGFIQAAEDPGGSLNWSPSTDIAAAWEVVRKMLDSGWGCEIYSPNNPYALEDADKWFVVFAKSGPIVMQLDFRAKAPSAPLAICHAALLAVEATQEKEE